MGRVLSPFSKVIRPQRIELAPKEPFGGSLKEVIESPVTDIAVQGISRIADLLNYRDRLGDETERQEAAQATQQDLEQQKRFVENVQAERAAVAAGERAPIPGFRAPGEEVGTRPLAAPLYGPSGVPAAFGGGPNLQIQQALAGTDLGQLSPQELQSLLQRVSGRPGGISGDTWQEGTLRPGMEGYEDLALLQQGIDPLVDPSVYRGEVEREGEEAYSGKRTRLLIKKLKPYADALDALYAAKGSPEAQTPERQALLDGKIAEIEAAMAALAPQLKERFVPRDLADFRMVAKDLQGRILAAESEEEREVLRDQLRETVRTARSAMDMPSTSLSEAVGGVRGREAQETVVKDIDAVGEAYAKQMKEAARLKREEERDARAIESHAMKVARFDERNKKKKAKKSRGKHTSGVKLSSKAKLLADTVEEYMAGMTWEGGTWGDDENVMPGRVSSIIKKALAGGDITKREFDAIEGMVKDGKENLSQLQSKKRVGLSQEGGVRSQGRLDISKDKFNLALRAADRADKALENAKTRMEAADSRHKAGIAAADSRHKERMELAYAKNKSSMELAREKHQLAVDSFDLRTYKTEADLGIAVRRLELSTDKFERTFRYKRSQDKLTAEDRATREAVKGLKLNVFTPQQAADRQANRMLIQAAILDYEAYEAETENPRPMAELRAMEAQEDAVLNRHSDAVAEIRELTGVDVSTREEAEAELTVPPGFTAKVKP